MGEAMLLFGWKTDTVAIEKKGVCMIEGVWRLRCGCGCRGVARRNGISVWWFPL